MLNLFPYANFHNLNLDWILDTVKKLPRSINNTFPDKNGNINLPGVSGVTSVNGIGADGSGNINIPLDFIDITTAPGFDSEAWADNTTVINDFIETGKRYYFPPGNYVASIVLPEKTEIYGAGERNTHIYPSDSKSCVIEIQGNYCKIKNMHLICPDPYNKNGLWISDAYSGSHSNFENLIIENCYNGIYVQGTLIWASFINVMSWGNKNKGLYMIETNGSVHNLNNFINCTFNDNVNAGVWLKGKSDAGFCENFYGCNIENNLNTTMAAIMGVTVDDSYAFINNSNLTLLSGCYFESNGSGTAVILNYKNLTLESCIFVKEDVICYPSSLPSKTTLIGCKDYATNTAIFYNTGTDAQIELINNDFSIEPDIGNVNRAYENIKPSIAVSSSELDLSAISFFKCSADISSLVNAVIGKIFYVYADGADITLASGLFADGVGVTVENATAKCFIVANSGNTYCLCAI